MTGPLLATMAPFSCLGHHYVSEQNEIRRNELKTPTARNTLDSMKLVCLAMKNRMEFYQTV